MGLERIPTGWANRMEYATICTLSEIESNNGLNFGDNRSCNVASTNSICNCVEESVDDSSHMEVSMELVRKNITVLAFDNKNSSLSTFFLQLLKNTENGITNLNVNNGFGCIDDDLTIFDTHVSSCCCHDSIIDGCRSFAGLMFANGSNFCSGGDEARRHNFNSLHSSPRLRCLVLF